MLLGSGNAALSNEKIDDGKLAEAAERYIAAGEISYAAECLWRITGRDVHILYNKALCFFIAGQFSECRDLLMEAEAGLSIHPASARLIPDGILRWEYGSAFHPSPMMMHAPDCIRAVQILRLKAECAARLDLDDELRYINSLLNCRYRHIEDLIRKDGHEDK